MATNQVLLLKPVEGLGSEGDTVTVRSGFARNFLLPRKIAVPVTQANKKQMEATSRRLAKPVSKRKWSLPVNWQHALKRSPLQLP